MKQSEPMEQPSTITPRPLFLIPARGGSKGIPHKNIVDLNGRPLIAYTIEAAKQALGFLEMDNEPERIIVSTDDDAIAEAARRAGAPVPFMRPAHIATDTASSYDVILHAMEQADALHINYNMVVLLQPTSPLRTGKHVAEAIALYCSQPCECDMVVSVTAARSNPYYNCFETNADGYLAISKGDGLYTRRQDAPKAWEYNGAIYVMNPASLRRMPIGAFTRRIPYEMDAESSVDIDSPLDLTIVRALLANRQTAPQ